MWGKSTAIDLKECDLQMISSKTQIHEYAIEICKLIDMKRYGDPTIIYFGNKEEVLGYSLVQLIETSSITGHFAEHDSSAYIDIFSCKEYDARKAAEFTKQFFGAKHMKFSQIERG